MNIEPPLMVMLGLFLTGDITRANARPHSTQRRRLPIPHRLLHDKRRSAFRLLTPSLIPRHHREPSKRICWEVNEMRIATVLFVAVVALVSSYQAEAKTASLVSPALTSNISGTDSVQCLISNLSSSSVDVNIVLFNGAGDSFPNLYTIPANGTDGPIAFLETNYYSRCVATPTNGSSLSSLRGSHCVIDANRTAKACVELR